MYTFCFWFWKLKQFLLDQFCRFFKTCCNCFPIVYVYTYICNRCRNLLPQEVFNPRSRRASISRETITVIACGNALGCSIPQYFIVLGKKHHRFDTVMLWYEIILYGAKFSGRESGQTKKGIAQLWFNDYFLPSISPVRPQLLIFDGLRSYYYTEFIKIARDENIILGKIPTYTSHWTRPFDRSMFKSLKSSWNTHVDNYVKHLGVSLGHSSFLQVFGKAWDGSVTAAYISSGF